MIKIIKELFQDIQDSMDILLPAISERAKVHTEISLVADLIITHGAVKDCYRVLGILRRVAEKIPVTVENQNEIKEMTGRFKQLDTALQALKQYFETQA